MPATEKKAIRCVIRYFSKDTVLKNVLEAQCEGYKISNLIELAVSYHSMTGGYLNIGTVAYYDEYPEKKVHNIYIPVSTEAWKYLTARQSDGISIKKSITDVINKSIDIGENTKLLTAKEFMSCQNKLLKAETPAQISAVQLRRAVEEGAGEKKDLVVKDHPDNKENREKNSNDPADTLPVRAAKRKKQMTFFDEFTRA